MTLAEEVGGGACLGILLNSLHADRIGRRHFRDAWQRACGRAFEHAWTLDSSGELPLSVARHLAENRTAWRDAYHDGKFDFAELMGAIR